MPKIASTLYQTVDLHLSGTTIYLSVKGFKNLPIVRSSTFRLSSSVHDVVVKIALTIIYFNHFNHFDILVSLGKILLSK